MLLTLYGAQLSAVRHMDERSIDVVAALDAYLPSVFVVGKLLAQTDRDEFFPGKRFRTVPLQIVDARFVVLRQVLVKRHGTFS